MADGGEQEDDEFKYQRIKHQTSTIWETISDREFKPTSITAELIETIFTVFDDKEFPICEDKSTSEIQREVYSIAVKCCSKVLNLLVSCDPIQCKVDCPSIVKRLLEVINSRSDGSEKCTNSLDLLITILDSIVSIICNDKSQVLQAIFVGVSCFQSIVTTLEYQTNDNDKKSKLFASCIKALSTVTYQSSASKEVFKATVGYDKLCHFLKALQNPTEAVTLALLDWDDCAAASLPFAQSTPAPKFASQLQVTATPGGSLFVPDTSYEESQESEQDTADSSLTLLNTYLRSRSISPVRYTLQKPWDEASSRTRREHVRKAKQAITAVVDDIAPSQAVQLWRELLKREMFSDVNYDDAALETSLDETLIRELSVCYNNASGWVTRRQILSYMADKLTFKHIQKYIPGITRYRFTIARKHILEHGKGVAPQTKSTRIAVPPEKLSHFLDFITSPHLIQDLPFGSKTITLSNKEVIKVPNVIRNMIPERIVSQYQAFAEESSFVPMSRSTLLRILRVCSASTRKSLQGLDYITAAGTEAFDCLEDVVNRLEEMDGKISTGEARQLKDNLKTAKRYLKNDYKAVEGCYEDEDLYINNVDVILLILDWIPSINIPAQRFAVSHVRRLCKVSMRNAMLCSVNGVFGKIVSTLDTHHQSIDDQVAVTLIEALEELGSFSVRAAELKQMISLFRPFEDGSKVKFSRHLLRTLLMVSCSSNKKRAHYYFDLHNKLSGITLPIIQKWIGSGFTFFTWLCIEQKPLERKIPKVDEKKNSRREIYSFFTSSGVGVEAFLSKDQNLVVATCGRKEYHTVLVPDCRLMDGQWHCLSIAHIPSRRPFGQSTLLVCIDGVTKATCSLKFHSLGSEELSKCHIGCGTQRVQNHSHVNTPPSTKSMKFPFARASSLDSPNPGVGNFSVIAAGSQDSVWGSPVSLQGQLGPICVFSEGLVESYHTAWYRAGPNNIDVFQPPDTSGTSQGSLFDVSSKLVLFYHAKAVRDFVCSDLTPPQPIHIDLPGRLSGHQCVTWNIKDAIQGIGGMEIFLPLLEAIRYTEDESVSTVNLPEKIESTAEERQDSASSEDWTLIRQPTDIHDLRNKMADICNHSGTQVSLFLYLILNIMKEYESNVSFHDQSLVFIAHMLQSCDARLMDPSVLRAIQDMIECVNVPFLLEQIYEHIVFNFAIWSACDFQLRIGHIQFISTIVKDKPSQFKTTYGVQFLLDVIKMYYAGKHESLCNASERAGAVEVSSGEVKMIRASLLGLLKFYLIEKPKIQEARCLVDYLQNIRDPEQVIEILDLLNSVCTRTSQNKLIKRISDPSNVCVFMFLLQNFSHEPIRLKILKLMAAIISSPMVPMVNKDHWRLKNIGLTPLIDVLKPEASISIVLGLLELAVDELSEGKGVQVYGHYDVVLAVVRMILDKDLETKLLVSHMILMSLNTGKDSTGLLANQPAWFDTLFYMLTVKSRDDIPSDPASINGKHMEELVHNVLRIVLKTMWKGVPGHDNEAWKNRGQVITAVSTIASSETFVYPSRVIERRLLEMSLQAVVQDIQRSGQTGESETSNALMTMRLVEDFVFTSVTGQESEDSYKWSVKLVDCVAQLLEAVNVWTKDDVEEDIEWGEMAQIGGRILLGFLAHQDTNFCATASSKLSKLLKARTINSQVEVCFVLGKLYQAFADSRQKNDSTNYTFIVPIIRLIVLKYHDQLPLTIYVPSFTAPDKAHPSFEEEFVSLIETDEFKAMMRQQIAPAMRQYIIQCDDSSVVSGRFWMNCLNGLKDSLERRDSALEESQRKYEELIIQKAFQVTEQQQERCKKLLAQKSLQQIKVTNQWLITKRNLSSDRAVWANRNPEETYWKLSSSENVQRMRLKLCQNYNFHDHADASAIRDNMASNNVNRKSSAGPFHVAQEAMVHSFNESMEEEDLFMPNSSVSPPTSPRTKSFLIQEKVLMEVDSEFITLMDRFPGKLKVSTTHVYFTADRNKETTSAVQDFAWALTELREVHLRRYSLRRTALEFFLVDQTNYFINFSKDDRNLIYKSIMSQRPPNLYYIGARTPVQLLKASGLTERWVYREISNFEYLMQLNTIAGRSYNDLSQYPIFPWIISDYKSKDLDLNDPGVYRDLSKPMGALNPERAEEVRQKFNSYVDPTGMMPKFHYGTHYSNSAGVLYYLLRVEPFTTLHIKLQNDRFDHADRQFFNIPMHWDSIYNKSTDVKELIPEFFCFPEFLENSNRFDLGNLQNGQKVDDVILPRWAKSPNDFIYKHRQALESEFVSKNLHHWIDLIFGYKQRGKDAEEALNVFSFYTYEGAIDLDAITDPSERISMEGMINDFGQTPTQLLTTPHPHRMTKEECALHKAKVLENTGSTRQLCSVFDYFDKLKAYFVEVSDVRDPLIFAAVPCVQARNLIHHGMPDVMVTISRKGVLGAQDWLPYSKTRSRPFTFELDPALTSSRLRRSIAAPFQPDLTISPRLFAISNDARIVVTGGHWDCTIRIFAPKGKLISRIKAHSDVVTCLAIDNGGRHLITGSRDTTCRVWTVAHYGGWAVDIDKVPLQILYGHDREITCVAINWELDVVVSGSADGICTIYTARRGEYVRTLRPMGNEQISSPGLYRISSMALTEYGNIIVFCYGRDSRALCRYSINGQLLADERSQLKDDVTDMKVYGEYIVTGGSAGRLSIRDLHSFQEVKSLKLRTSITCVSLAKDNSHIFATLVDGKLIVIAVDLT